MGISVGIHGLALAGIIEGVYSNIVGTRGEIELQLVRGESPPKHKVQAPEGPKTSPPHTTAGGQRRLVKKPKRPVRARRLRPEPGFREAALVAAAPPQTAPLLLHRPATGPVGAASPVHTSQPKADEARGAPIPSPRRRGPTRAARLLSSMPAPVYPRLARRRGEEGVANVRLEIHTDGRIGRVELAKSSGSALLDAAALRAVRRWRFAPSVYQGRAISGWVRVPVRFALRHRAHQPREW
ncbi:MAG: energy transducer TonB [Deltaproteobacteria bacterium]|nr:energy transducer TonB [Deltaproteobacteria bacterium]